MRYKYYFFTILLCLQLISCGYLSDSVNKNMTGLSYASAFVVYSINEEYGIVQQRYPNAKVLSQALISHNGKPYDILEIQTPQGAIFRIHFDISKFFGKRMF